MSKTKALPERLRACAATMDEFFADSRPAELLREAADALEAQADVRDLLISAAAMAVVTERRGEYPGAAQVADAVLQDKQTCQTWVEQPPVDVTVRQACACGNPEPHERWEPECGFNKSDEHAGGEVMSEQPSTALERVAMFNFELQDRIRELEAENERLRAALVAQPRPGRPALAESRVGAQAMTWIKCSEQMPPDGQVVLVAYAIGNMWISARWDGRWIVSSKWLKRETITHWQPLPKPPKEDTP